MPVWIRLGEGPIPLDDDDAQGLYEALLSRANGATAETEAIAEKIEVALAAGIEEVVPSREEKHELWQVVREQDEPSMRPFAEALEIDVRLFRQNG
jgi:hypothetical protein